MPATFLILGLLAYFGGWLAHNSEDVPDATGWAGAPGWVRVLLRRGKGRIMAVPLIAQFLGVAFFVRFLPLAGVLPTDPYDFLTRQAITVAIFGAGAASLWLYLTGRAGSRR